MKGYKAIWVYAGMFVLLGTVMWLVLSAGAGMEHGAVASAPHTVGNSSSVSAGAVPAMHPFLTFVLQLVVIISVSRLCAYMFRRIGQPAVIGEIVAGILLGPSLMGTLSPQFSAFIFPAASLGNLQMLSQAGLVLFMFVIGMELDTKLLRERSQATLLISTFSIVVPFTMGIGLSWFIYHDFASPGVPFYTFSLFTGIAMSITAFPVLARIIRERGIGDTRPAIIAIGAAALNDVSAWCILAFIVAIARARAVGSSFTIVVAAVLYIAIMLFAVKPLLKKLASGPVKSTLSKIFSVIVVILVLSLSTYCCDRIGIHALFGAFFAGVIMPQAWDIRRVIDRRVEEVVFALLLPLFFVSAGLRTHIGLLNDSALWLTCLAIVALAVAGKFGGSTIAARIAGESKRDSLSIGALMNTRGLVELVVLNIGYDLGIISQQLFTMMVLMALITTFMTNPLLNIINKGAKKRI